MSNTFYQSVRVRPQTIRSEVYLTGDIAYTGVLTSSAIQQLYDTNDPYLLRYLTDIEKQNINFEDARKTELSYLITNAIKMWLQSKVGDYGRFYPGMGGPLDEYIGKIVSDERAKKIKDSLTQKVESTFNSVLTINTLTVTPVPARKAYAIQFVFNYILVNKAFTVQTELRV